MLSRSSAVTGIDLGHQAVKLVRLNHGASGLRLTHWGVEELPLEGEGSVDEQTQALVRLLKRLKLKTRQLGKTATSVGGSDVHLRQVSMPRLSLEELRRALPYEAKKHLPIENLLNPCLDFQILDGIAPGNGADPLQTQEVLLVAAPEARRKRVLDVMSGVGIHPEILDVNPLPSVNAVLSAYPSTETSGWKVILDVGAQASVLAAVLPDGGFYSRPLEFTGESLTHSIEARMSLDHASAEIVKREYGNEPGPETGVIEEAIRGLVHELEETIRFLRLRRRAIPVDTIYLTGGGSLLRGLEFKLSEALGIEVVHPDPFDSLVVGSRRPELKETPWLLGALGLARWWE